MLVEWKLEYKDKYTNGKVNTCTYTGDEYVTQEYLEKFWGVEECDEYKITKKVLIE